MTRLRTAPAGKFHNVEASFRIQYSRGSFSVPGISGDKKLGLDWVLQVSHVLPTAALGLVPFLSPGSYSVD